MKAPRILLLGLLAGTLAACAPVKPRVDVRAEPGVDFSAWSSWNFVKPLQIDESGFSDTWSEAFRVAIAADMNGRGFTRSKQPQLIINVAAVGDENASGALNNDPYQTIHPQRGTFYSGWRGYGQGYGSQTQVSKVSDGAFSIGVFDAEGQKLLWEGVASGRLGGKRSEQEIRDIVSMVVSEVMKEFPGRPAG